uniref:Putative secreted protein n=1 Tax=Ixodes ricinus TaxID=34613 RepID=A0A6B0UHK0_IXORI
MVLFIFFYLGSVPCGGTGARNGSLPLPPCHLPRLPVPGRARVAGKDRADRIVFASKRHSARASSIPHLGRSPPVASLATEHPGSDRRVQKHTFTIAFVSFFN